MRMKFNEWEKIYIFGELFLYISSQKENIVLNRIGHNKTNQLTN